MVQNNNSVWAPQYLNTSQQPPGNRLAVTKVEERHLPNIWTLHTSDEVSCELWKLMVEQFLLDLKISHSTPESLEGIQQKLHWPFSCFTLLLDIAKYKCNDNLTCLSCVSIIYKIHGFALENEIRFVGGVISAIMPSNGGINPGQPRMHLRTRIITLTLLYEFQNLLGFLSTAMCFICQFNWKSSSSSTYHCVGYILITLLSFSAQNAHNFFNRVCLEQSSRPMSRVKSMLLPTASLCACAAYWPSRLLRHVDWRILSSAADPMVLMSAPMAGYYPNYF